jgi:hypothetical protein
MSSVRTKWLWAVFAVLILAGLTGCIADTAADSDLPWATNHSWESLGPLPSQMTNPYD